MTWGLATVVLSAQELFAATRPVYFKCLPLLGVQSHIKLPWRTLPEAYQGIGQPNFGLHALAAKLQFIQCNWGFTDAASKGLSMGYESFLMNVGMYSNTLDLDYKSYSGSRSMELGSKTYGNFCRSSTYQQLSAATTKYHPLGLETAH